MSFLLKYRVHIGVAIIIALIYFYGYNIGYNKADNVNTQAHNKRLQQEIAAREAADKRENLATEKYRELDQEYEKNVKTDVNYKCVVPTSLRNYINAI